MLSKADGKLIHALKSRVGREKHGLFVAEGVRVVEDVCSHGRILSAVGLGPWAFV